MIHDVIVVGAGPGGSSAATFCAHNGASTLLLDKAKFPREKVCGDGLTPQAIYWLDQLGCVEEVLDQTNSCIKKCDLYINGEHVLTGGFPKNTIYPDFTVLLDRYRFDDILMRNALNAGAQFKSCATVKAIRYHADYAVVSAMMPNKKIAEFKGRIIIGADGVSSVISRAIGNVLNAGARAISLRTYFRGVAKRGSQVKVYFDERFFPGYGWLFVDDAGYANVGMGYACDNNFPMPGKLRQMFLQFIATDLQPLLGNAEQCGDISGGSASFYRPTAIVADRVMLVGDAANQADPLNGGGIHKAMESAYIAAHTASHALQQDDFCASTLSLYEDLWKARHELDWRTAEIFLSVAKNPNLKEFCLFSLKNIAHLTANDPRFHDFCSGVFSGVISQSVCLSPSALYHAFPRDLHAWLAVVKSGEKGIISGPLDLLTSAARVVTKTTRGVVSSPLRNLNWGLEVASKATRLVESQIAAGNK